MPDVNLVREYLFDTRKISVFLLFTLISTFVLSFIFYRGTIDIGREALSDMGSCCSISGESNHVSTFIFSSGMMVSAILSAFIYRSLHSWRGLKRKKWILNLMKGTSFGFALLMMPNDAILAVHLAGLGLLMVSLWGIIVLLLDEIKGFEPRWKIVGCHILLHASVLSYLVECLLTLGGSSYFQKVAFISLAIIFLMTLNGLYVKRPESMMKIS
jgi:hypothetical protein